MSIYSKSNTKINIGASTPSYSHKKINSFNFICDSGRIGQGNSKKQISKKKIDTKSNTNLNSEINIYNSNNYMRASPSINKVLTSSNLKNRKIDIDLNKNNNSPQFKFNKSVEENIFFYNKNQSPSHNNNNYNKNNNYKINFNNNIDLNKVKHKKSKNSLNNINININISKKIISNYYNKSKDKKSMIVKKKSYNSFNNSKNKGQNCNEFYKISNNKNDKKNNKKENMLKNQSETFLIKKKTNESCFSNYHSNLNKIKANPNSLAYFSNISNISTTNNNNNNNLYSKYNDNFTNSDIYQNYYSNRDFNKKNNGNSLNKIIKEDKSTLLSKIQMQIGNPHTSGNINSIQNYLKYLNINQKNKNSKNGQIYKNKSHKLSANNLNNNYNMTESNIFNNIYNNTYHNEGNNIFSQNIYNKLNDIDNLNIKLKNNKNKSNNFSDIHQINNLVFESPEELHYFYIKLLQKGNKLNFDKKNK